MASLFGSSTKTSTSTNQMYPALQQGWDKALSSAADIYDSSKAPKLAPMNDWTRQAFDQTHGLATSGVPNLDQLYGVQSGILGNGGYTSQMTDAANYYKSMIDAQPGSNPYLNKMLDTNADRAFNRTATSMGNGRFGSAAIGNAVGQAVSDANNSILAQAYENDQNRRLSAMNSYGGLAQAGAGNMATQVAMSPALNELRYDGASRIAGMGDFIQNRTQGRIDQLANFPKQDVGWYTGILSGMGNNGSTTITNTPGPSAAQSILGGAAMGAGIGGKIPGLGAGWGALGGGILGAFA